MTVPAVRLMPTELGPARVHLDPARRRERVLLVLGHGAGGGVEAADLVVLAERLPDWGVTVARVEQPWRVAGRRLAPAPRALDLVWLSVLGRLRGAVPLVVGGRSAGARVACRTAGALHASGVVALAFPLHPPGRPDRARSAELAGAGVPALVLQGERDPFGSAAEVRAALDRAGMDRAGMDRAGMDRAALDREPTASPPLCIREVAGADHGFAVGARGPLTRAEALELIAEAVRTWVLALPR